LSLVNSFQAHSKLILRIKQSPFNTNTNTNYVATSSSDKTVKIWNVSSLSSNWTLVRTYSQHSSEVVGIEWLDEDTLVSAGWLDQTVQVWSLNTGLTRLVINTYSLYVDSFKLLNNKIQFAAGVFQDINIYNISDGNLVSSLKGHTNSVVDFVQISDKLLASSSCDYTVRIWNLTTNTCIFTLIGHTHWVYALKQITPSILASGSLDNTIKLWYITSGNLIRTLTGHTSEIWWSVDLLNSETLVSGSLDQTIKLWNWSTGECLSTIQTNSNITSLAVIDMNSDYSSKQQRKLLQR